MKDVDAAALRAMFDCTAQFPGQMDDIDRRERIGAFDDQQIARVQTAQRLAGTQNGQRALEPFEIEMRAAHIHAGEPCG